MIRFIISLAILTLTTAQAFALSCVSVDMAHLYKRAADSEKTFVVLKGEFDFAPRPKRNGTPVAENYLSTFSGTLLTANGFTKEVSARVTVNTSCMASWCGQVMPNTPYLAFVEQSGTQLTLNVGPCPQNALRAPTSDQLKQIVNCASGLDCEPRF